VVLSITGLYCAELLAALPRLFFTVLARLFVASLVGFFFEGWTHFLQLGGFFFGPFRFLLFFILRCLFRAGGRG
jgi:hypothetical protein